MFVGLGQALGRAFDAYPNRVVAYSLNIGGSLAGILGFSALSFAQAPPGVLVSHKLCRSGLSALSRQGLVAPASPHAWGAGGVFRATYRVAKSARNPFVALLRCRPKQGDRRDRRQQHRSSNNGALRRWRLLLFVDSLAAATNRRSAIPGRSDHRRRIWQRHSARAALWCEQDRWGRD